jgi:hypothetical protein
VFGFTHSKTSAAKRIPPLQVLIHPRVRSHPALVLPITGGRYSHGFQQCLLGRSPYGPDPRIILSCTLNPSASRRIWYFRVLKNRLVRISFRVEIRPFEAFCPCLVSVSLSDPPNLAYGFTSSIKAHESPCCSLRLSLHKPERLLTLVSGFC